MNLNQWRIISFSDLPECPLERHFKSID